VLEGKVAGGPHLGKQDKDGEIHHRPGRDVTLSAPKSVSLMALVGGDDRIVGSHDRAVTRTFAWVERNRVETPDAGQGHRGNGPRGRAKDGDRNLPPRHLPKPRAAAPHPCGGGEHGAGRGWEMEVRQANWCQCSR